MNGRHGAIARVVDLAVAANDRHRLTDLDHLVVELIADQRVAVGQPHGTRRQGRWIAAWTRVGNELPDWVVFAIDFDNATVVGVGEQGVAVGQHR